MLVPPPRVPGQVVLAPLMFLASVLREELAPPVAVQPAPPVAAPLVPAPPVSWATISSPTKTPRPRRLLAACQASEPRSSLVCTTPLRCRSSEPLELRGSLAQVSQQLYPRQGRYSYPQDLQSSQLVRSMSTVPASKSKLRLHKANRKL